MIVFEIADQHEDQRRKLTAFRPPVEFPKTAEAKVLITKQDGVRLGNHSHPHLEGFFLVSGSCVIKTWTELGGAKEQILEAPIMFMFEPDEEHLLVCSNGMTLVGYMPVTFEEENNAKATHLELGKD